jgi:hypothetical protein
MTASTHDELIAGFLHSSLPKVIGDPTFEDLKIICRYLNTNVMSVSSYEEGGRHGHLGLIMTNDENFVHATDVFTAPDNPEPHLCTQKTPQPLASQKLIEHTLK